MACLLKAFLISSGNTAESRIKVEPGSRELRKEGSRPGPFVQPQSLVVLLGVPLELLLERKTAASNTVAPTRKKYAPTQIGSAICAKLPCFALHDSTQNGRIVRNKGPDVSQQNIKSQITHLKLDRTVPTKVGTTLRPASHQSFGKLSALVPMNKVPEWSSALHVNQHVNITIIANHFALIKPCRSDATIGASVCPTGF